MEKVMMISFLVIPGCSFSRHRHLGEVTWMLWAFQEKKKILKTPNPFV